MIRRGRKNNGKFGWLVFMAAVVLIAAFPYYAEYLF